MNCSHRRRFSSWTMVLALYAATGFPAVSQAKAVLDSFRVFPSDAQVEWIVVAADHDGDGRLDVEAAWMARSDGHWEEVEAIRGAVAARARIPGATAEFRALSSGDLDGDSDLDVVGVFASTGALAWFPRDGPQSFDAPKKLLGPVDTVTIGTGDVDGDGDLDLLSVTGAGGRVWWMENRDGAGSFSLARTIGPRELPARSITTFDADRDGDLDVLIQNGIDSVFWYENLGPAGTFAEPRFIAADVVLVEMEREEGSVSGRPGLELSITGSCVGAVSFSVVGAAPGAQVVLAAGAELRMLSLEGGQCGGRAAGLVEAEHLKKLDADGSGEAWYLGDAPNGSCGSYVRAVDLSTCSVSNLARLD